MSFLAERVRLFHNSHEHRAHKLGLFTHRRYVDPSVKHRVDSVSLGQVHVTPPALSACKLRPPTLTVFAISNMNRIIGVKKHPRKLEEDRTSMESPAIMKTSYDRPKYNQLAKVTSQLEVAIHVPWPPDGLAPGIVALSPDSSVVIAASVHE